MPGKILIVEDEKDIAVAFQKQLSLIGKFEVEIAGGGEEALEMLRIIQYDLILLDLAMPQVDGIVVLQTLQADKEKKELEFHHAPVIVLTNVTSKETQKEVEQYGVADYIVKSDIRIDKLLKKVEGAIKV